MMRELSWTIRMWMVCRRTLVFQNSQMPRTVAYICKDCDKILSKNYYITAGVAPVVELLA